MAFNWQTFRTRALTAIVFVVVMLIGLLWNQWSFLVLFSIIHFGCWWEYFNLVERIYSTRFHSYLKLGLMLMGYGILMGFCDQSYSIAGYGLKDNFLIPVTAAGFALTVIGIFQKNKIDPKAFGISLLGLIYISLSWELMIDIYGANTINFSNTIYVFAGYTLPVLIILSIWVNDTMAYIVGSLIGKTPLTKISPKKTWEGTVGGIILGILAIGLLYPLIVFGKIRTTDFLLLGSIAGLAAIAGTFGDILESKLKRMAGVKDSGSFMPGHGGFLDRFDSLLIAIPFVWIFLRLFS